MIIFLLIVFLIFYMFMGGFFLVYLGETTTRTNKRAVEDSAIAILIFWPITFIYSAGGAAAKFVVESQKIRKK